MQRFRKKVEARNLEMNPTTMVHITMATIDSHSLKETILGFSVFPLFIDADSRMPVINSNTLDEDDLMEIDRVLHSGNYQLPIFCEYPPESNLVTYEHFMNLERIPTASLLLRVDYASIDGEGNFLSIKDEDPKRAAKAYDPPPKYED